MKKTLFTSVLSTTKINYEITEANIDDILIEKVTFYFVIN